MRGPMRTITRALGIATVAAAFAVVAAAPAVAAEAVAKPTFTKDIAPIFQEKCEACHRTDSIAPMSLVTYEEARPWAKSIAARVGTRQMPPWHIDKTIGIQEFKNDRSLTDDELATIVRWVDAGAPQGDPKDMPPAKVWPDGQGWNYAARFGQAEPDLIIEVDSYHFVNFFYNNLPSFCVGMAEEARGPQEDWCPMPRYTVRGHVPFAQALFKYGVRDKFDLAAAHELRLDHSLTVPLHFLNPKLAVPIVPVIINTLTPPMPSPTRSRQGEIPSTRLCA